MAKGKSSLSKFTEKAQHQRQEQPVYQRIDPADKQERVNGKKYTVNANCSIPGGITVLPPGTELRECNDGYFSVYIDGSKLWFRVGGKIMEAAKEHLTHKELIIV